MLDLAKEIIESNLYGVVFGDGEDQTFVVVDTAGVCINPMEDTFIGADAIQIEYPGDFPKYFGRAHLYYEDAFRAELVQAARQTVENFECDKVFVLYENRYGNYSTTEPIHPKQLERKTGEELWDEFRPGRNETLYVFPYFCQAGLEEVRMFMNGEYTYLRDQDDVSYLIPGYDFKVVEVMREVAPNVTILKEEQYYDTRTVEY